MLQQRLRINILSCVSRKHLASLKILRCRRESETGKHLPLLGVLVLCTRDQLQTGHGREWRRSWAFLYTFPHATEFLRLLLLLQHRARDAKSSLCCLLLAHPRHQPVPGVPVPCSVCVPPLWAQGCLPRTQGFHPSLLFCGHPSTEQKAPGSRCRHSLLIRDRSPPGARRSCPRDRSGAFWALSPLRCRAGPRVPTAAPQWRHNRLLWGQNLI